MQDASLQPPPAPLPAAQDPPHISGDLPNTGPDLPIPGPGLPSTAPVLPKTGQHLAITMGDFCEAVGKVQPSVRREGFATTPNVTWADVGALDEVILVSVLEFPACLGNPNPKPNVTWADAGALDELGLMAVLESPACAFRCDLTGDPPR